MNTYTATGTLILGTDRAEIGLTYEAEEADCMEKFLRLIMRENSPAIRVVGLSIVRHEESDMVLTHGGGMPNTRAYQGED